MSGEHIALTKCFYCLGSGDILIHTHLRDISRMKGKVVNMEPCSKCKEYMKKGIILITIDESKCSVGWNKPSEGDIPNPYRAGGFVVITEKGLRKFVSPPSLLESILKHRWTFIDHNTAVSMGMLEVETND